MISCTLYQNGHKTTPELTGLNELLQATNSFAWVRLDKPNSELLHQLKAEFSLHELAIEDTINANQRPKLETYGDTFFLVVHTAVINNARLSMGEVHLFLGAKFLISIHHHDHVTQSDIERRIERLPSKLSLAPITIAYLLLDTIIDRSAELLASLQQQFQTLEKAMFNENMSRTRLEKNYHLKHQLIALSEAISPIADICDDLVHLHTEQTPKALKPYLRDVQDHATRLSRKADLTREMLMAAMQVNLALVSIGQNDTTRKLAGWAAIFAIPTVIFGLYGMNFQFMPELHWRYGYFIVLGGTLLICSLVYRKLKRNRWL